MFKRGIDKQYIATHSFIECNDQFISYNCAMLALLQTNEYKAGQELRQDTTANFWEIDLVCLMFVNLS